MSLNIRISAVLLLTVSSIASTAFADSLGGPAPASALDILKAPQTVAAADPASVASPSATFDLNIAAPGSAAAPEAPAVSTAQPGAGEDKAGQPGVDETALRYYASQHDVARVAAEIRRLRSINPDWRPPEDLFRQDTKNNLDMSAIWKLFSQKRYDQIRAILQAEKTRDPSFVPPAELVHKLDLAQARDYLVQASDQKDSHRVIAIAGNYGDLLTCSQIDVMWRVAEALGNTGDMERAFRLYQFTLANCTNPQERLATVQKASLVLPAPATQQLLAMGQLRMDGTSEFDSVRLDLVRRRVGDDLAGKGLPASPEDVATLERLAGTTGDLADAALLGWYDYKAGKYDQALQWFIRAGATGDEKALEGRILTLREMGKLDEAETVAYDNRGKSNDIAKIYVEIVSKTLTDSDGTGFDDSRLPRFLAVVQQIRSSLGAQSAGWHAFNAGKFDEARIWFDHSMEWEPNEPAALGQVLVADRTKDKSTYKELVQKYSDKYAKVAELSASGTTETPGKRVASTGGGGGKEKKIVALFKAGQYQAAIDAIDAMRNKSNGMKALRGWALFKSRQFAAAKQTFVDLQKRGYDNQSVRYGIYYSNAKISAWKD